MGTPLTSATVASTYQALLKVGDNSTITGINLKSISDGLGNDIPLMISPFEITNYGAGSGTEKTSSTAFGRAALINNTTGSYNVALGWEALRNNTTGYYNVAVGVAALKDNIENYQNVAVGNFALSKSVFTRFTVAIGDQAGGYGTSLQGNVLIGQACAQNLESAENNVMLGYAACANGTGSNNVVLGMSSTNNGKNACVVLGREAAATDNNQFVVGSSLYNAGAVTTETVSSTRTWSVTINGVARKILLA